MNLIMNVGVGELGGNSMGDEMSDSGEGNKGSSTHRVWTKENEIALMKGLIDFSNKNTNTNAKTSANLATEEFKAFLLQTFHLNLTKKQLSDKLSRLKAKFRAIQTAHSLTFSTPHDQTMYELSNIFWGTNSTVSTNTAHFDTQNSDEEVVFSYHDNPMRILFEGFLGTHNLDLSDVQETKLKGLVDRWKKFKVRECEYLISRSDFEAQVQKLKRKRLS